MNLALLYLLMLKATVSSFNGPSSLPLLREELVVRRQVLTDRQLNAAVTAGRSAPGPMGIYVVSVGYMIAGVPGALAGMLAMITPSLLVIPLIHFAGRRADHPRLKTVMEAVVVAGAGLVITSSVPLALDAITGVFTLLIAIVSFIALVAFKAPTISLVVTATIAGLLRAAMAGSV